VNLQLSVDGDSDGREAESLHDWLRADLELGTPVRRTSSPPSAGQMGSATDALIVAVGAGGSLTVLAGALQSWLSQPRRSRITVRVRSVDPGGPEVDIDADRVSAAEVERLLREALGRETGGD
jgi:Effector Associated Constant Component 1